MHVCFFKTLPNCENSRKTIKTATNIFETSKIRLEEHPDIQKMSFYVKDSRVNIFLEWFLKERNEIYTTRLRFFDGRIFLNRICDEDSLFK